MRLSVLLVVAAADSARRELGKRKQGAKTLAAMTKECRAVLQGPAYHEPQKSIVRCLEYGTRCPQLA